MSTRRNPGGREREKQEGLRLERERLISLFSTPRSLSLSFSLYQLSTSFTFFHLRKSFHIPTLFPSLIFHCLTPAPSHTRSLYFIASQVPKAQRILKLLESQLSHTFALCLSLSLFLSKKLQLSLSLSSNSFSLC